MLLRVDTLTSNTDIDAYIKSQILCIREKECKTYITHLYIHTYKLTCKCSLVTGSHFGAIRKHKRSNSEEILLSYLLILELMGEPSSIIRGHFVIYS